MRLRPQDWGGRTAPTPRRPGRAPWGRRLVVVYLALLFASHAVRFANRQSPPEPPPSRQFAAIGDATSQGTIQIAYREWPAAGVAGRPIRAELPTIVLLHGSPGSADDFAGLAPGLAARGFRVLAPDLPGFGASRSRVDEYSIRASAHHLADWLDTLGVESAHFVGFSLGGGPALHLADPAPPSNPRRVRSLVLLASIGAQEYELLGRYRLNHAIHGVQLAALWLLNEAVPHFGALDDSVLSIPYARSFYDTDQRPLRGVLERLELPTLVVHGETDFLVPIEAARESHRLVPQSELLVFPEGHFLPFQKPDALVAPIVEFVRRVEQDTASRRSDAPPERLAAARGDPIAPRRATGPTLLVWMLLLALATLVSEDLTCIGAGLLVAAGTLGFLPAVVACGVGILAGDLGLFLIGRLGRGWLGRAPLRWLVSRRDVERSRTFFDRRGAWVIFASRFVPGLRLPTYLTAGILGMAASAFLFWLFLPVALWTPLLVGASNLAGEQVFALFDRFEARALPTFVGLLLTLWVSLVLGRTLASWRGRRRWRGAWMRVSRWEFWPPWIVYPPLLPVFAGLAARYGLTTCTAANPSFPAGGGIRGESKSAILDLLPVEAAAPWRRLEPGPTAERRATCEAFQAEQPEPWPIVLKPDVGERGTGVTIARSPADIEAFLDAVPELAIIQRFVPGVEVGLLWVRRARTGGSSGTSPSGDLVSITDKRLPHVVGDGESTLERLVWDDPRAVALAETYLERLDLRSEAGRDTVPAAGEPVPLADLGTHCRGAVFWDGDLPPLDAPEAAPLRTAELEAAVDRIARAVPGFDLGRFDIKAPSFEHIRRGEGLQVLELNGLTSEPTSIYDPRHSILHAWRELARQWRAAYRLGAARRAEGHEPLDLLDLLRLLR